MAQIAGIPVSGEDLYTETTFAEHKPGTLGFDHFGNRYRYVKAGAVALVTGELLQEPAEDTQFNDMAVPAAVSAGVTDITVTNGTTAVTAGMFNDGVLFVSVTPGIGQQFRILSHTTGASGAAITYTVDRPVKIALTTSSKVTVRKNSYDGVIQNPTTPTGGAVGIALYALSAGAYGWIQSGGQVAALADTGTNFSAGVGGVSPSGAVAGAVKPQGGVEGSIVIGQSMNVTSTDGRMLLVHLFLD